MCYIYTPDDAADGVIVIVKIDYRGYVPCKKVDLFSN